MTPDSRIRYPILMRRTRTLGLVLVLLLFAARGLLAQTLTQDAKNNVLKALEVTVTRRAFVAGADFSKWPEYLEKHRKDIDAATDVPSFTREVNRAFREFGVSHLGLRSPRQFQSSRSTSTVGIGVIARKEDEGLRVFAVLPTGPAASSGLEVGDVIVEVDGKPALSTDVLDGDEGSKLAVKVKKPSGEVKEIALERRRYSTIRPETLTWVDEEAAVLRIPTFNVGYNREAVEKLVEEAARAKYLIVDLRSNGGGLVANMRHLLGLLLPEGSPIGTSVTKPMSERFVIATKGDPKDVVAIAKWVDSPQKTRRGRVDPFPGRIAVLINRGSGSASEITAAALKEDAEALLVGTRSAGAVLTSLIQQLPEGFGLQYPVTDYITAHGVRLEGHPLMPDIEVTAANPGGPTPPPASPGATRPDIVVERAVEKLREISATAHVPPGGTHVGSTNHGDYRLRG